MPDGTAIEQEETAEQLKELTTQSKHLKTLREKRDSLRTGLQGVEQAMMVTVARIATLTAQIADQGIEHTNGKGKKS